MGELAKMTSNSNLAKNILLENGYSFDKEIIQDGNLYRIGRKNNQWYICYDNYLIAGDWQNQLPEIKQFINSNENNQQLTPKQKQELERKIEEEQKLMTQQRIS